MKNTAKKYRIENQSNQLVASEQGGWCLPESIYAKEFTVEELIDFESEELGINILTYYDNTGSGSVVIGWAEADSETSIAVAIPVK